MIFIVFFYGFLYWGFYLSLDMFLPFQKTVSKLFSIYFIQKITGLFWSYFKFFPVCMGPVQAPAPTRQLADQEYILPIELKQRQVRNKLKVNWSIGQF
jgi:hypothetical protein